MGFSNRNYSQLNPVLGSENGLHHSPAIYPEIPAPRQGSRKGTRSKDAGMRNGRCRMHGGGQHRATYPGWRGLLSACELEARFPVSKGKGGCEIALGVPAGVQAFIAKLSAPRSGGPTPGRTSIA